jgi:uncharacterized protein YyaL (SSP411 family)
VANRLGQESSPYLRQHADNPVDWYPWGDEAFAAARQRDVPILLSVGYSACHWCHVMAHESFEDPDVAGVMNELFVNIKVDREERPDVDAVYMEAVQAMTGQGGWPMTVFLAPDGRPFFGGTYFPPRSSHGRPGFVDLLRAVDDAWRNKRTELLEQAEQLSSSVRARSVIDPATGETDLAPTLLEGGLAALRQSFDAHDGGFGMAPKFPQPTYLDLAMRAHLHDPGSDALAMVTTTLDAMASGGIYDHLGGGFARYSTDPVWLVPHFEKMLYDQAGLARAYLHAWQLTGGARYLQVVEETVEYVRRDLAAPGGAFCSAEDADSEGVEGRFYVWSLDEVLDVGGPEAVEWYGATAGGNFEGANILFRPVRGDLIRPPEIEAARARLFERRAQRVRPGLDDKVLTEWNGMMISVLAEAGGATGRDDWVEAGVRAAEFLLANLRTADGRWLRAWHPEGGARHRAYAVDHAWLVDAFTRLAAATGTARWIADARAAADALLDGYRDPDGGGFFTTAHDAEQLIVRSKDVFDGATPSANSVAAVALLRLGALPGETRYTDAADEVLRLLATYVASHPTAFTNALAAVDLVVSATTEIAVVGDRPDLVAAVQRPYQPNAVLAWGEPYPSPLWEGRRDGLAYVCRNFACLAPVDSAADLLADLAAPVA